MKIVKVKKLWLGHTSVRDYIVKKCIDDNESLMIEFNGESNIFGAEDLKKYMDNSYMTKFKSKYDGKEYTLIDLPWNPQK